MGKIVDPQYLVKKMIDPKTSADLQNAINSGVETERHLLEELLIDARSLKKDVKKIHPMSAAAVSLVGADGGNNKIAFDPFLFQIIRVVDSSENVYCLEVITPNINYNILNKRHICDGKGVSPLGRMCLSLGVAQIQELSPMLKSDIYKRSVSWIQVYRELTEWAVLYDLLVTKDFGTDTVIIYDGFLRSKVFKGGLFGKLTQLIEKAIGQQYERSKRKLYLIGIAKHSKFIQRYRLAMATEGVLKNAFPAYVKVPENMEKQVYKWDEYATGGSAGESFVAGIMHLVKFGESPYAPIWAIDILQSQIDMAPSIMGYLLTDAADGFPIPSYPRCLQKAHEKAALVDFDMDILQDQISIAIRGLLGEKASIVDELALQVSDPAGIRYS